MKSLVGSGFGLALSGQVIPEGGDQPDPTVLPPQQNTMERCHLA